MDVMDEIVMCRRCLGVDVRVGDVLVGGHGKVRWLVDTIEARERDRGDRRPATFKVLSGPDMNTMGNYYLVDDVTYQVRVEEQLFADKEYVVCI